MTGRQRPKFTEANNAATPPQEFAPAESKPEISADLQLEQGGIVTPGATITESPKQEIFTPAPPAAETTETNGQTTMAPVINITTPAAPVNTPADLKLTQTTPPAAPEAPKEMTKYIPMPIFNIADSKVSATTCAFRISAKVFSAFLKSISLNKLITDSYLEILPNNTMISAFAEPSSQYVLGFLAADSVKTITPGQLILTDMNKLASVIRTMETKADDQIEVGYSQGKITLTAAKGKRAVELIGIQENYINSLKGLVNKTIDIENKKIGKLDFSGFTQFETDISMFNDILEAAKAINLPSYRFEFAEGTASVRVVITNAQDKYELDFEPQNFIRNGAFKVTFAPAVAEVTSMFTGTVKVYINADCMIIGQHNMYYLIMAVAN